MCRLFLLLTLLSDIILLSSAQIIKPCKVNDIVCITKSAKAALPQIISGVPSAGVETSDPLFINKIVGDVSILKISLFNSTITGFSNCDINNIKLNLDNSKLLFDLTCPSLTFDGGYTISGRLIILPVEGNGNYHLFSKKYQIGVETEIKKSEGKDGKQHLSIKNIKLKLEAKDGATYNFENLFNGNKELADTLLKFANQNWKEVADLLQEPIFLSVIKKITGNLNKYLKTIPFDDLFLQE